MAFALPPDRAGSRQSRLRAAVRAGAGLLAAVLTVFVGLQVLAPAASASETSEVISDPTFYALESGTIASANGANGSATTRVRLASPAAVDPTWQTLSFTQTAGNPDIDVTIFAYDANGTYISPSTGFKSLAAGPYSYTIPARTAAIRYVVKYHVDATITPADHESFLTIGVTGTRPTTPPVPPSTSNPAFNDFEQGTIASATGAERDGASDLATRIRLKEPVAVDPSWQALKFDGGRQGSDVSITIFAYDASGTFLSPSTGWKNLARPYVYAIPAGTATIDYALSHDPGNAIEPISVGERSPWLTLSTVQLDPRDNYHVNPSTITPQLSIPGFHDEQGGNFVNEQLWVASASSDGHATTNGRVYVYDVDYVSQRSTLAHTFTHNFGHLNSFSYDRASGNLIFGNGSGSYTQLPAFFVVKASNIDLDGANTLTGVNATTFDVPDDFGAKCNVIWTDQPDVAVMLTDDGTTVRKIQLLKGAHAGQYGQYTPAADDAYNGTFDVLGTYHINMAYDVVQSAAWVDGKLVIGLGHGPMSIAVITLQDEGHMDYQIYRNAAQPQFFEAVFYDPVGHFFGGVNTNNGVGYFWDDKNFTFEPRPAPVATTAPSISGSAAVGDLLSADRGFWDTEGLTYSYQWVSDGTPITGATSPTLLVTGDLAGKNLAITVTTSRVGWPGGTATSVPVTVATVAAWSPTAVYSAGDTVLYAGAVYNAKRHALGDVPGALASGPWAEQGVQVATSDGLVRTWTPSWFYADGDTVVFNGHLWQTTRETRNQVPGGPRSSPWQDLGAIA